MRHRSLFVYRQSKNDFLVWFCGELASVECDAEIAFSETKYESNILIRLNDGEMEFSIFENPSVENGLVLSPKPKLKFMDALFRKNDVYRERASLLAHKILSQSSDVSELGWYLDSQGCKGSQPVP